MQFDYKAALAELNKLRSPTDCVLDDSMMRLQWMQSYIEEIESALQTMCKLEALKTPPSRMPTEITYDPNNPADTSQNVEYNIEEK